MNENSLLKTSLIISVLGVLVILFMSENIETQSFNIKDITKDKIDEKVKIKGEIVRVTNTETVTILNIKDSTGEITSILFDNQTNLRKNQKVQITGTVAEYKSQIEIIVDEIKEI